MIQKMISNEAAGIFALATTISFIIWILEDSVWNAWIPWLYAKISQGEEKEVAKPWTSVMHMFGILSWVIVMLAPEAIAILGPAKYRPAVWLIAPMVSGTLFQENPVCSSRNDWNDGIKCYFKLCMYLEFWLYGGCLYYSVQLYHTSARAGNS